MLILDLWGIGFHAVVVFGLGKEFSFKSILGRCDVFHQKTNGSEKKKQPSLVGVDGLLVG